MTVDVIMVMGVGMIMTVVMIMVMGVGMIMFVGVGMIMFVVLILPGPGNPDLASRFSASAGITHGAWYYSINNE